MEPRLLIVADDRTGAMEVAGAAADAGFDAVVAVQSGSPPRSGARCVVIDIASRHEQPDEAAARVRLASPPQPTALRAHKVDSLLRGRWAAELAAYDVPVLLVAANPLVGRRCIGGMVRDGNKVVGRPADALGGTLVEVRDASSMDDVDAVVGEWLERPGAVLAGTGAVLGRAAERLGHAAAPRSPGLVAPVVVACGSLHPVARRQIEVLTERGVQVVATTGAAHPDPLAGLRRALDAGPGTLLVIGGDSAATVLGDAPVDVGGTMAPGIAWGRRSDGSGPLLLTKPGSFPMPDDVIDALAHHATVIA
jgi:D-threonate/D-erythronate kinase